MSTTTRGHHESTGVLVPLRSFTNAKSRLATVLDASTRAELVRSMAARVITAAAPLPVWVVTDDESVAEWARGLDVSSLSVDCHGLDESIHAACAALRRVGIERVVVAHGDLPLARSLAGFEGPGLTIAPDRRRDGSNVLAVPTDPAFHFAYGEGSYRRHVAQARRLGLAVTVIDDPTLALDVDEPADLDSLGAAELARLTCVISEVS